MGIQVSRRELVRWGFAAAVGTWATAAAAAESTGVVDEVRGLATARRGREQLALAAESALFLGDLVATGDEARARLLLGRATQVMMGGAARLTIDRFLADAGGVVRLGRGAVLIDREPAAAPFQVRSPYGLIAVRGTRFFVGPTNGLFSVFVDKGSVAVRAGGAEVVLNTGEGTDIPRRGAPPSAPRTWGAARVAAAMAQVE